VIRGFLDSPLLAGTEAMDDRRRKEPVMAVLVPVSMFLGLVVIMTLGDVQIARQRNRNRNKLDKCTDALINHTNAPPLTVPPVATSPK
jgi:hypothetical protein